MLRASTTFGTLLLLVTAATAADLPSPERVGRLPAGDGVELHFEVRGSGPRTLVALHGGPGLSSAYLAPDLATLENDFTLIHYDQRGAGRSTVVTDPDRLRLADHVEDVEAVRKHFGLEKVTLLGHSWGAGPAAFYALRHPETTDRVILLDPMPPRRSPYMERFGEALVGAMDEATQERFEALDAARADAADPVAACRAYWEALMPSYFPDRAAVARVKGEICDMPAEAIRNGDLVYEAALGEGGEGDWDWRELFHGVTTPVLVLVGADSALPAEGHAEWKAAFPNAELVAIDGAGHFLHVERPDAFREAVTRFLSETGTP